MASSQVTNALPADQPRDPDLEANRDRPEPRNPFDRFYDAMRDLRADGGLQLISWNLTTLSLRIDPLAPFAELVYLVVVAIVFAIEALFHFCKPLINFLLGLFCLGSPSPLGRNPRVPVLLLRWLGVLVVVGIVVGSVWLFARGPRV